MEYGLQPTEKMKDSKRPVRRIGPAGWAQQVRRNIHRFHAEHPSSDDKAPDPERIAHATALAYNNSGMGRMVVGG